MASRSRPTLVGWLGWLLIAAGGIELASLGGILLPQTVVQPVFIASGAGLPFVWGILAPAAATSRAFYQLLAVTQSGLDFLVGAGLLGGKRRAWVAAQVWAWLLLADAGIAFFGTLSSPTPPYALFAFYAARIATLVYWRRAGVKAFFGAHGSVPAARHSQRLEEAARLLKQGRLQPALDVCQSTIRELTAIPSLTAEHQRILGSLCLVLGQVLVRQGRTTAAAESYLTAREMVRLPPPALSFLAPALARERRATNQAVEVYLEYLKLWRGQLGTGAADPVYSCLEGLCRVDSDARPEARAQARAVAERVLEADESLPWAHLYLGLALAGDGDYSAAVARLEIAERLDPNRKEASYFLRVYRGVLAERQGDRHRAIGLYREAAELVGERPEARFYLGRALVEEADGLVAADEPGVAGEVARLAAEAVSALATSARPLAAEHQFWHGRACALAGESRAAVGLFQKAVELDRGAREYHLRLAAELGRLGEVQAALWAVERAAALDGPSADAHQIWGDLLAQAGQRESAVTHYRQALTLDARHSRARLGLGRVLYEQDHLAEAGRELAQVQPRTRESAYLLARCYSRGGQFAEAVPLLVWLTGRPDASADAYYYLGCALANLRQTNAAIEAFDGCLQRDPSRWQAHLQRGHCHLAAGDAAAAGQAYQQAQALRPDQADVAAALGRWHLLRKEDGAALPYLEQAIRREPAHWEANVLLAELAARTGDAATAERSYLAALAARPDEREPRARLGLLYCHQGRYGEARDQLRQAAEAGLDSDAVLFHWGYALAQSGDYAGARGVWGKLGERHPDDQRLQLDLSRLRYLLGRQHAEAGRYEEAIREWRECLESRPADEALRRDIAELHFRLALTALAAPGQPKQAGLDPSRQEVLAALGIQTARASLRAALDLNGDHPYAPFYLALCELLDGKPDLAIASLERLAAARPALRLRATYHKALALLRAGEPARAAETLGSVANSPDRAELELPIEWARAMAYALGGQWEATLASLQPLLSTVAELRAGWR